MAKHTIVYPVLPKRGYFTKGDKGEQVKRLQTLLNVINSGSIVTLKVDGDFGASTEDAVCLMQTACLIKVDGQFGSSSLASAKKTKITSIRKAVNWTISVAMDDSFAYGSGDRAHRSGCYFCKTNTGDRMKKKERKGEPHYVTDSKGKKHTYEKTYCCNPFITAAYAHGTKDKTLYDICHAGKSCGMAPADWKKGGAFSTVGTCKKVKFESLKPGDVILSDSSKGAKYHHVWMYIGGDRYVEASGGTWSANSIAVKLGAKNYYNKYYAKYNGTNVVRYSKDKVEETIVEKKAEKKRCIDISNWQGVVATQTFKNMKKDIPWVIIRSSYTHTKSPFKMDKDKSFDRNLENAYTAGMKIGVYHYSQATSVKEAEAEADYVIGVIRKYKSKITLPVVFDFEFGSRLNATVAKKLGKNGVMKVISAFCDKVKKAGYDPMVYANLSTLNNYISQALPEKYKVWVAQYNDTLDYKKPCYMWQYTSSGRVQGVGGKVDLSYVIGKSPTPHKPSKYKGTFPVLPKRGWFAKGDKGTDVKRLQALLNWLNDGNIAVDGEVGAKTIAAVKQFQRAYKLKVDGEFGKDSLAKAKTIAK